MEHTRFKTEAIVIKEKDFPEADKIFTLFTKEFGKIEVLGKAIQKIKAKLRGGLQVLNYISLEFIRGKNFNIATDAILKNEFFGLKSSPQKFRYSIYICNILDKLVKGQEKDKKIWNLLLETLGDLENNGDKLQLYLRYFEWNLLSYLGLEPDLYFCLSCQKEIKGINFGKLFFSSKEGGILCNNCQKKFRKHKREISKDVIKILRLMLKKEKQTLKKIKINPSLEKDLKGLSKDHLQYVLEEEVFVP